MALLSPEGGQLHTNTVDKSDQPASSKVSIASAADLIIVIYLPCDIVGSIAAVLE